MKKCKQENTKKITTYIIIWVIMLLVFCIAMIVSYALPNEKIQYHIKESTNLLLQSNTNPLFGEYIEGAKLDEFTDLLIINTARNKGQSQDENLLKRAFGNSRFSEEGGNQYISLEQAVNSDDIYNNEEYPWYWHGIQSFLRPLLIFFNVEEIKYIYMFIMFILLALATIVIEKNLNIIHSMVFVFSMLSVSIFIVPVSLQYSNIFFITLLGVIFVNLLYKAKKEKLFPYMFFIIGGCSVFFDLLTAPLLTLGIPLIYVILLTNRSNKYTIKENITEILKLSILWGIAYASIFFAKWVIASIILNENIIDIALRNIIFRVNGNSQYPAPRLGAIRENLKYLYNSVFIALMFIISIIWVMLLIRNRKKVKDVKLVIVILIISLYPYVWYFIFAGHSTIHSYFTYRIQAITILSVLSAMIECINTDRTKDIGREK